MARPPGGDVNVSQVPAQDGADGEPPAGEETPHRGLWPDLTPWRSSRGFRLVFASRTVTGLGTQALEVGLLVQAKQLTDSRWSWNCSG